MIDSKKILYPIGNNDECYTPSAAVKPILKYIKKDWVIWCPFDTAEKWDAIVSNPPFTNKRGIFARALSFNKPFALIMSNTWLNDAAPKQLFKNKPLQLLMFEERIKFINTG